MSEIEKIKRAETVQSIIESTPNNTKLTNGLIKVVAELALCGGSARATCQLLGVTSRTYRNWMRWGREGKAPIYAKFFDAVKRAEAAHALEIVQCWNHDARRDWRAARAFLESRFPEEWGSGRHRKPERQLPPPVVINVTLSAGQTLTEAIPPKFLPYIEVAG
jgi:hypothetical protein